MTTETKNIHQERTEWANGLLGKQVQGVDWTGPVVSWEEGTKGNGIWIHIEHPLEYKTQSVYRPYPKHLRE